MFRPNFGNLDYKGDANLPNHQAYWTQPQLLFAQAMQKYWRNLAKYGKPGTETINQQTTQWCL